MVRLLQFFLIFSNSPTRGSRFGEVRAWNQSSEAVSLDHPPTILTLVSHDHNIPVRHRELVLTLNRWQKQDINTHPLKHKH